MSILKYVPWALGIAAAAAISLMFGLVLGSITPAGATPSNSPRAEVSTTSSPVVRIIGSKNACSGFLVGPTSVATAAHCLKGDASYRLEVQPKRDAAGVAWSVEVCDATPVRIDPDYDATKPAQESFSDDFALLAVTGCGERDDRVGDRVGYFTVGSPSGGEVTSLGYPGDEPNASLWSSTGERHERSLRELGHRFLFERGTSVDLFTTHAARGNSGGVLMDESGTAVGVTVGVQFVSDLSVVRTFDEDNLAELRSWLAEVDPASTNAH